MIRDGERKKINIHKGSMNSCMPACSQNNMNLPHTFQTSHSSNVRKKKDSNGCRTHIAHSLHSNCKDIGLTYVLNPKDNRDSTLPQGIYISIWDLPVKKSSLWSSSNLLCNSFLHFILYSYDLVNNFSSFFNSSLYILKVFSIH